MYIEQKRFNWLQRPSAYQEMQTWRERQAEHRANAEAEMTAINEAFVSAATSLTSGMMEIAAKRAAARVNAAIQDKVATSVAANGLTASSSVNVTA